MTIQHTLYAIPKFQRNFLLAWKIITLLWGRCVASVPNINILFSWQVCPDPPLSSHELWGNASTLGPGAYHVMMQVSQSVHVFLAVVTGSAIGPRSKSGLLGSVRPYSRIVGTVLWGMESLSLFLWTFSYYINRNIRCSAQSWGSWGGSHQGEHWVESWFLMIL